VRRTRLPFLDVTVGLVWGSGRVLLIDTGTTLDEAHRVGEDVREFTQCDVSHIVLTRMTSIARRRGLHPSPTGLAAQRNPLKPWAGRA
jgi:hypothetical protein